LARQVAIKLGFLPLALTQAGSYISERQISFQKYITLLDGEFRTVTSAKTSGAKGPNKAVFTTWEISFAALSHSAQELLSLCGFLANSDIPDALFIQRRKVPFEWVREGTEIFLGLLGSCQLTCVQLGDMWLMDSLAELFSFSLAKRKASQDAFWIHPVVHSWARERLDTHLNQKKAEEAIILFGGIVKGTDEKQPNHWAFERRIWPHIESIQRSWGALSMLSNTLADGKILFQRASGMGQLCIQHGLYSPAVHMLEWALDGYEKTLGKDHPSTLNTVHNMAMVFDKQGQLEKALKWYGRALDGTEKTLGKDHPSTLNTVHNMAMVFDKQGQLEKALKWYGRALDGTEKILGKDHLRTLTIVHNMAGVFRTKGQYEKALEWYGRALDGYEKTLRKDHLRTLKIVRNMALVFDKQGQNEKALEWYGRALNGTEKTLGKDHPSTLNTFHDMGGLFDNQGQYEKALEWYRRALNGTEKTLGKDHPSTRLTLRCMEKTQSTFGAKTCETATDR
jgi:tetratricopeptide (TPR) repeat protein